MTAHHLLAIFAVLAVVGILILRSVPADANVDRDMPRGCIGLVLIGIGGVGTLAMLVYLAVFQ